MTDPDGTNGLNPPRPSLDVAIGRLLIAVTYVAVALLLCGVVLLVAAGVSPLAAGPAIDPGAIPGQLTSFVPVGFLWAGIVVVIATPISRVVAAAIAFARDGDRRFVAISAAILVVIAIGVLTALASEA
jgi:uncharacterized membrane protein